MVHNYLSIFTTTNFKSFKEKIYGCIFMHLHICTYIFVFFWVSDHPENLLIHSCHVAYPSRINTLKYFIFFIYTWIFSLSLFCYLILLTLHVHVRSCIRTQIYLNIRFWYKSNFSFQYHILHILYFLSNNLKIYVFDTGTFPIFIYVFST